LSVSGSSNSVPVVLQSQPYEHTFSTGASSITDATDDYFSKHRWPFFITLLAGSAGVLLAMFAFNKLRQNSAAVAAFSTAADTGFAKLIGKIEAHISTETDPAKLALLNSIHSEANKQRGTVAANV